MENAKIGQFSAVFLKLDALIFSELREKESFFCLDGYLLKKFSDNCGIKITHNDLTIHHHHQNFKK